MRVLSVALVVVALTACDAPNRAEREQTSLILQCDGESVSVFPNRVSRVEQRRTYRIDLEGKSVAMWNPEKREWSKASDDREETLEVSESQIIWQSRWSSDTPGDEGANTQMTIFDRTLGTVSTSGTMIIPGLTIKDTFKAKCLKVDEPSTERVF